MEMAVAAASFSTSSTSAPVRAGGAGSGGKRLAPGRQLGRGASRKRSGKVPGIPARQPRR